MIISTGYRLPPEIKYKEKLYSREELSRLYSFLLSFPA